MSDTGTAATALGHYVKDWRPQPVETTDFIRAERARELAATLDLEETVTSGDPLPLLWQWVYFPDWPPTADLGPDGHPRQGHFLPPIPNRRRMFAGGRITVSTPLTVGELATRRSAVVGTVVKHGRTGELLFVTVRHEYSQNGQTRLVEEQDLVYRSDDSSTTSFSPAAEPLGAQTTPWGTHPRINPCLLFRFSALTGNAHRIHYDQPYATAVEGYPGVVVHGPLLAVYMAELVRTHSRGRTVGGYEFRLLRPVFGGDDIRVQGTPADDDGSVALSVVSGNGTAHASAKATYL